MSATITTDRPTTSAPVILAGLLTRAELAAELRVNERTIFRLAPPSIKLGNKVLYNPATVREWILSHERPSRPDPRRGRPASKRAA